MPTAKLTKRQKAAIVVRLLLAEGVSLPLSDLPECLQAELTAQMVQMRFVDRATLRSVIEEFATELDSIGLAFPGGLEGALSVLEGAISPDLAARLRAQSSAIWADDPWEAIATCPADDLLTLLQRESPQVGAVILSKLKVPLAAELLSRLPGTDARRLTLAMSQTGGIKPDTVHRIGVALAAALRAKPPRAFPAAAVSRLGAILNVSPAITREELLEGLDADDQDLGARVRAEIFIFADIPDRIATTDIPAIVRKVDQEALVTALCGAETDAAVDFIFANISQRMADSLRGQIEDRGAVPAREVENARTAVVIAIREAADAKEITILTPEGIDG